MEFKEIVADLALTPAELSRRLGVSDGHVHDLLSGRRKLSLKIAAALEPIAQRTDIVAAVVAERTGQ